MLISLIIFSLFADEDEKADPAEDEEEGKLFIYLIENINKFR